MAPGQGDTRGTAGWGAETLCPPGAVGPSTYLLSRGSSSGVALLVWYSFSHVCERPVLAPAASRAGCALGGTQTGPPDRGQPGKPGRGTGGRPTVSDSAMRAVVLAAILAAGSLESFAMAQVVTGNVISRVHRIRAFGKTPKLCSAFAIDVREEQFLITAAHCFEDAAKEGRIEVLDGEKRDSLVATLIRPKSAKADIVALRLLKPLSHAGPLDSSSDGITLSQQVYYLGFPFGKLASRAQGWSEIPFVKAGILSAMDVRDADCTVLYIDGMNNPGLSGGPVVFRKDGGPLQVAGVISARENEAFPVVKAKDLDDLTAAAYENLWVRGNSGIVVAHGINAIVDAIKVFQQRIAPPAREP